MQLMTSNLNAIRKLQPLLQNWRRAAVQSGSDTAVGGHQLSLDACTTQSFATSIVLSLRIAVANFMSAALLQWSAGQACESRVCRARCAAGCGNVLLTIDLTNSLAARDQRMVAPSHRVACFFAALGFAPMQDQHDDTNRSPPSHWCFVQLRFLRSLAVGCRYCVSVALRLIAFLH
jgi:hypothetical protein